MSLFRPNILKEKIIYEYCSQVSDGYTGTETDVRAIMLMIFPPILLLCWIRNLKLLAPFSTMATAITMASFGITLYYVLNDIPSLSDREPVGNLKELPLFFGTVMFSMSAIGIVSLKRLEYIYFFQQLGTF